jgi:hypothetical protein
MSTDNKLIKSEQTNTVRSTAITNLIDSLKEAEYLAEVVINSETFGKAFEKWVDDLNESGNPQFDKDGNKLRKTIKSKEDVIAAIVLGKELGIPPMAAITLGKTLNAQAYAKVLRGKKLGLDPMTAIQLIHAIPTQNGITYSTGIHVISGTLLKNKIKFKVLEDYDAVMGYTDLKGNRVKFDKNIHFVVDANSTEDVIKEQMKANKILVVNKIVDRKTTVEFNREGYDPLIITYTIQEAIDAGLYKGINSDGEKVEGKANWNNHPAVHLRNRAITIGGRIIAADYLDGMYDNAEVIEFTEYKEFKDEDITVDISDHLNKQD